MTPKKEKIYKLLQKYHKKHENISFSSPLLSTKNKSILKIEKLIKLENKILKKFKLNFDELALQILYRFINKDKIQEEDLSSCFQLLLQRMREKNS